MWENLLPMDGEIDAAERRRRIADICQYAPLSKIHRDAGGRWRPEVEPGESGLTTLHGPAIVTWSAGWGVNWVWWARLPDGRRCHVRSIVEGWRQRRSDENDRWIYGQVELTETDAIFRECDPPAGPSFPPPEFHPSALELQLARDEEFRRRVLDEDFAFIAYQILNEETQTDIATGAVNSDWPVCESPAGFISRISGRGNSRMDYEFETVLCSADPAQKLAHIQAMRAILDRLGWRSEPDEIFDVLQRILAG